MVTLIELKKEKMLALKNHDSDKMNVLGIVISSLQKLEIEKKAAGKEITEVEMVSILNKTIKELTDEKAMYEATGGTNTHKGAIFSLGILLAASGYDRENIRTVTERMLRGLTEHDFKNLDQKEHLSKKTINKYLSYLKKYFIFLAENHLIESYPLFTLKGISFKRKETIIINWMPYISNFLNTSIHPETIKLLIVISLGYDLNQLLNIRWLDVSDKLNDINLKKFLFDNLTFDKTPNPYIFQGKRIDKYTSIDRITSKTKMDQHLIDFPINPRKLRQSYILSIISNQTLSDEQLLDQLHISQKSLGYYKFCANYFNLIPYKK